MDWNYFAFSAQQTFFWMQDNQLGIWREPVDDDGVVLYKQNWDRLTPAFVSRENQDGIPFFPTIADLIEEVKQRKIWILYTIEIWDTWYKWLQQLFEREDREEFLDVLWENHISSLRGIWAKVIKLIR